MPTFWKHDLPSRVEQKRTRKAEQMAEWAAVCKEVDARDSGRCRACGRRCDVRALTLLERAQRHHIQYRSLGGEDFAFNVVTICSGCHSDQHAGRIDIRGNASFGIEVWARDEDGGWYLKLRESAVHIVERD